MNKNSDIIIFRAKKILATLILGPALRPLGKVDPFIDFFCVFLEIDHGVFQKNVETAFLTELGNQFDV